MDSVNARGLQGPLRSGQHFERATKQSIALMFCWPFFNNEESMKTKTLKLLVLSSLVLFSFWVTILRGEASSTTEDQTLLSTGLGSTETLESSYRIWTADFEKNGGERNIILPMSSSQGMSTQQPGAYGLATLNLIEKKVSVEVRGLAETQELDFWLIDNKTGQGTILPEDGDDLVKVGSLKIAGGIAKLDTEFSSLAPEGFEPD